MRNTARQNNLSPRSYTQHIHSHNSENLRDPTATCCAQIHRLLRARTEKAVDPQVWLADVLSRIAVHPAHRLDELLP
jgi:hypothetical protein